MTQMKDSGRSESDRERAVQNIKTERRVEEGAATEHEEATGRLRLTTKLTPERERPRCLGQIGAAFCRLPMESPDSAPVACGLSHAVAPLSSALCTLQLGPLQQELSPSASCFFPPVVQSSTLSTQKSVENFKAAALLPGHYDENAPAHPRTNFLIRTIPR